MIYEVKNVQYVGQVKTISETVFKQVINVTTGIAGQNYDGFINQDTTEVEFTADMTVGEVRDFIIQKAVEFSSEKYPNT